MSALTPEEIELEKVIEASMCRVYLRILSATFIDKQTIINEEYVRFVEEIGSIDNGFYL